MKIKNIFILLFAIILIIGCKNKPTEPSFEQYINVPGDYSNIQSAIDASVNGDTILVEPGTYYENINFNGKNITLASKFILDNDENYVSNTIIDGNNNGRVVTIENSNNAALIGFTIQNGYINEAYKGGGGINIKNSNIVVRNCHIKDNILTQYVGAGVFLSDNSEVSIYNTRINNNKISHHSPTAYTFDELWGAGICAWNSNLYLSNVSIHDNLINHYQGTGAGIKVSNGIIEFDKDNRCSIYNNSVSFNDGDNGNDIYASWWSLDVGTIDVYLDTFTVMNPSGYYAYPIENFTFDIQNSIIEQPQLLSEYFVDPNGSNSNSGATPEEPLKNISYILNNAPIGESDSITIHLANGTYSSSTNSESFPLIFENNISIIGESEEGVIIDPEQISHAITIKNVSKSYIENLTIQNGLDYNWIGGGINVSNSNLKLKNITIKNCYGSDDLGVVGGGISIGGSTIEMDSITVTENGMSGLLISNSDVFLKNSKIYNNGTYDCSGGGIACSGNIKLENVQISNNYAREGGGVYCSGDVVFNNVIIGNNLSTGIAGGIHSRGKLDINNCIVANNTIDSFGVPITGGNILSVQSEITVNNSILWNGNPNNILVDDNEWWGQDISELVITYSNIENGENGIENNSEYKLIQFDNNINSDPLFVDPDNNDFRLQSGSPCIDAGNPDPQYNDADGSRNDMGAYGGPGGDW